MKSLINAKSILIGATVFITLNSAFSKAEPYTQQSIDDFFGTIRIVDKVTERYYSSEFPIDPITAGRVKHIDIEETNDDNPEKPYTVTLTTETGCIFMVTFKEKSTSSEELVNVQIEEKSGTCRVGSKN
ncbi:MAG: hypothetical protein IPL83_05365 [Bdellovibrionales bacterium]|nr:hypothetical protein [Bdellovibrionales bacterium]